MSLMKIPILLVAACWLGVTSSSVNHDPAALASHRRKLGMDPFVPLSCGSDRIFPCVKWTEMFGNATEFAERVIIECWACVTMDQKELTLLEGIDIQGKLFIDNELQLRASSITVQGELEMVATQPIDGSPLIQVILLETEDSQSFLPVEENAGKCSDFINGECPVGHKAITVAGGRVNSK